eukprot:GHVR01022952.1.p1 GENE.GHVR01022952.1~~GHVR01022952.1.p1  ORF type:complete len:682 (+),score=145.16 GHVR01022952.1:41-2086(+)
MANQLKDIVERLNAEPFSIKLSLIAFDEKTGPELLETLNIVLTYIDKKQHCANIRDESIEALSNSVTEFLHVLGYKSDLSNSEFSVGLMAGEKKVIHPLLQWLLINYDSCKKRAYLAQFLVNIDVPEEFLRDESLCELHRQYKELQAAFKSTHQHLEHAKANSVGPNEIRQDTEQLEAEKEQLMHKIEDKRREHSKTKGFAQLLEVTSMLRKEQEEEARLAERIREQRVILDRLEQSYALLSLRLAEIKTRQSDGLCYESIIKNLKDNIEKTREACDRFTVDAKLRRKKLHQLHTIMEEPLVTPAKIIELENKKNTLERTIQQLQDASKQTNQTDVRLQVYVQQANNLTQKKVNASNNLNEIRHVCDTLTQELNKCELQYQEVKGHRHLRQDQFKKYGTEFKNKLEQFKQMKAQLQHLRLENSTLLRTEQILQSREVAIAEALRVSEREHGVCGYDEVQCNLEKLSAQKTEVDQLKGVQLEEMSRLVVSIVDQLKVKKHKIAPKIKELRVLRDQAKEIEMKHNEEKNTYETQKTASDSLISKLTEEVTSAQKEVSNLESGIHESYIRADIATALDNRANKERKCMRGDSVYNDEYKTLTECHQNTIASLEVAATNLKQKQKEVKEEYTERVRQKNMLTNIQMLLEAKIKSVTHEADGLRHTPDSLRGEQVNAGNVNRLIIE